MRPLTDDETKIFFEKLSKYIGANIRFLIERTDENYVFRLIKDRVYYISEKLMKLATNVGRDELLHIGTCFGKFTKTGKFKMHITCLDYVSLYAKNKMWLKPAGEQSFLYGYNVIKAHLGKMTDNVQKYEGVVIYSMNDTPLGFGVAAKSTLECKDIDHTAVVAFNQSDIGEYLRVENE